MKKAKKWSAQELAVTAFLLIGIGLGLLLMHKNPLAIPAFTLIGLGIGYLVSFLISKKK